MVGRQREDEPVRRDEGADLRDRRHEGRGASPDAPCAASGTQKCAGTPPALNIRPGEDGDTAGGDEPRGQAGEHRAEHARRRSAADDRRAG